MTVRRALASFALLSLAAAPPAEAAQRTFVSATGADANPCSLAFPCRTFAAALSSVDSGGEVVALDSADYGVLAIDKSVSIIAPTGVNAGVTASSADGVVIAAGPSGAVVLRGLAIDGPSGGAGISVGGASLGALHVEHCIVSRFAVGIRFAVPGKLFVRDSTFLHNEASGIAAYSGSVVSVDRVRLEGNGEGIAILAGGKATVSNSVAAGNVGVGFGAYNSATSGVTELNVDRSVATLNGSCGVLVVDAGAGGQAIARLANSAIVYNDCGLGIGYGGVGANLLESTGTNLVRGNRVDLLGTVTTVPPI